MSALGQKQTSEGASAMSALPPKADMQADARVDHQVQIPPLTPQTLSPLLLNTLKLAPPIPNAGGADVRWRTVRDGPAQ